ncbi:MAG: PASTA domain-containing protein [Elusimicrobia bacterium]|nr:PASTA domain-containing protein [Elusimicrobiota bacterium]
MKRVVEGAFAFLFLAAVGYFSFHWAMEGLIHSKPERQIPDLRGRSVLAALDMLAPLKLGIRKEDEEFNDQVPIGAILRQYPEAGTIVREGKTVRVVIGQGGESVFVPSLIGLPLRNAEMLLRQRQLLLGEVSESFSLRVEKGFVLSQDPGAESSIEKNTMVNAVVSAGSPPPRHRAFPRFPAAQRRRGGNLGAKAHAARGHQRQFRFSFSAGDHFKPEAQPGRHRPSGLRPEP